MIALTFSLITLIILLIINGQNRFGFTAGTVSNPVAIFLLQNAVIFIDFFMLYYEISFGQHFVLRNIIITTVEQVDLGAYVYSTSLAMTTAGILLGIFFVRAKPIERKIIEISKEKYFDALIFSIIVLFSSILIFSPQVIQLGFSLHEITIRRQIFFQDKQLLLFMLSLNAPAAIYLLCACRFKSLLALMLVLMHIIILMYTGSRGLILFVILGGIMAALLRGWRFPLLLFLPLMPFAIVALGLLRHWIRPDGTQLFGNGVFEGLGNMFYSLEFSVAEAMTVASSLRVELDRAPFESFFAFVTYLVPRSMFPTKPFSASTDFSMLVHPEHFSTFRSETVVSGYTDMMLMFGWFGPIMMLFIGFAWIQLVLWVGQLSSLKLRGFLLTYISILTFVFLRSDISNMAPSFFAALFFLTMVFCLRVFASLFSSASQRKPTNKLMTTARRQRPSIAQVRNR